jgi:predicted NAD/FAD-binding protein
MWMADVLTDVTPATAAKIWKSWVTHRTQPPAQIVREVDYMHMLPTPATIKAQTGLRLLQGRAGIWFAGGYLLPYDSQETALTSALRVALGMGVSSERSDLLLSGVALLPD